MSGDPKYAVGATITVNGLELAPNLAAHVEEVVVDDDLHRPTMFEITLFDSERNILDKAGLKPGAEVEISVEGQGADTDDPLVQGDVVTVECEFVEGSGRIVVRGYDATHRLHRGRQTQAFHDATDSDVVQQVIDQFGLQADTIESTTEVHPQISQANQTAWEFLNTRAMSAGFDITVAGGKVRFGKRATADEAPAEAGADADPSGLDPRHFVYGYNLRSFHGRLSAAEQVAQVEVRGYDETKKEAVVATAMAGTTSAGFDNGSPSGLADAFGGRTLVQAAATIRTGSAADTAAKTLAEQIGSAFAEAEGIVLGNSVLRAGVPVRISRVSEGFNGAYVLSRVRHVISGSGYRTHFNISGRHDRSMLGLVAANAVRAGEQHAKSSNHWYGLVQGIVSDIDDPEKLGRVRFQLPWMDEAFISAWAPVVQLGAGLDRGTLFLPEVHDVVLIGFEHGSIDRPYVIGGLYNPIDKPPAYDSYLDNGTVTGRVIRSRSGHEISLHDAPDRGGIVIHVVDGDKQNVVSIGLNSVDEKLAVFSSGDVDVRADGNISVHGRKVTIEADGELVLKGATIKLN
jgi:phage protein D/phage baseplate assembly protein gpV